MKVTDAISHVDPTKWAAVPPAERLHLLEQIRDNMDTYKDELGAADAAMKNALLGEDQVSDAVGMAGSIIPIANNVSACIELYEALVHGEMPQPVGPVEQISGGRSKVQVFPRSSRDRLLYAGVTGYLVTQGAPLQVNPYDQEPGIIGVLGAGNFSSAIEMIKGLFIANSAVIHKPHHNNAESDKVWAKIMAPLVEVGALAFADADQSRTLTADARLDKIYFTGGVETAKVIEKATQAELVSELGGNNPCLVVPGDRPWTDKEIDHQAIQLATLGKLNGGAVCGRVQTIVTSKNWPQRDTFLAALRKALVEGTPAVGTYYPGAGKVAQGFLEAYPDTAEVLKPEGGKHAGSDFILIPDAGEDSYAARHEAFCQVNAEIALDVPAEPEAFLKAATVYVNERLLGSLGAMVMIDDDTKAAHEDALMAAVHELRYGAVAVNDVPPNIWFNPWLNWGGNEEGRELQSGRGTFGNAMCYDNVEKAILINSFVSAGHMMYTNKHNFEALFSGMARYAIHPSWINLTRLMGGAVAGSFRGKDF